MSKVFVTGGAGFIGSHIVDSYLKDGCEVHVIDDLSTGEKENLSADAKLHVLDIRTPETKELLRKEQPDVLVHAAAQISVRLSMEKPMLDTEINVAGMVNLLDAINGDKLPHVVFLSTGGAIYGEQEVYPAPESHTVAPTSIYGLAKRVGEMYLDFWAREMGLKYTALRLANVYGPRQNPHGEAGVVAIFNKALISGKTPIIFGNGKQTRDFVFVKDVVSAVRAASDNLKEGIYNIGTGIETSVNELYDIVCKSLAVEQAADYQPAKAGEQMRSSIDASWAKDKLGWQPQVSIAEGLKCTSEWFREAMSS